MTADIPFYLHKVECPLCGTINEFETIKVGAFKVEGKDTDFRPIGIRWANPKYQRYNPALFFVATCSKCFYSREYNSKFREWKKDVQFKNYRLKTIKGLHMEHIAPENSVLRILGSKLDHEKYPLQTAINKLLLAVYDELLLDRHSNMDVAKFFIRVAWLFREGRSSDTADRDVYLGYLSNLGDDVRNLGSVFDRLNEIVINLQQSINNHINDPSFESNPLASELKQGYTEAFNHLSSANKQLDSAIKHIQETINVSGNVSMTAVGEDAFSMPYDEYPSYRDFLMKLRGMWEYAPLNEHDALKSAFEFYRASYESGHEVSLGNPKIQIEYLMAELCRRLHRYNDAKKYFNAAIRSAQEFIYEHRGDKSATVLARQTLDLALTQGKINLQAAAPVEAK